MPAEIANIAVDGKSVPMMAYLGETPWHRLGAKMKGKPNVANALKAAHLDWTVGLQPLHLPSGKVVPNKLGVVRDIDEVVMGVVGSDYVPVQNSEAFGLLDVACKKHGVVIETAGALGKGDRVWMLAKLPETVEPVRGDSVQGYFLIMAGHNGYTPLVGLPTPVRVVCQNTLSAAVRGTPAIVKLRHVKNDVEQMEVVAELIEQMVASLKEAGESFAKLAAKKFDRKQLEQYVDSVLGIDAEFATSSELRRRANILHLATEGKGAKEFAPGTAWSAYNAVTEHVDHSRKLTAKPMALANADTSALFGPLSKMKENALLLAIAS